MAMSAQDLMAAGTSSDLSARPDAEDVLESCLEFLGSYVTKSLRLKYDKWQKLVTADESKVSGGFFRYAYQSDNY